MKFALGNVSLEQYKPEEIAYMKAQRVFIDHAFEEAKSVLGLDEYQTRKWIAWYYQVALNMLLLLFISKERSANLKHCHYCQHMISDKYLKERLGIQARILSEKP
jgi:hypothetical protein